MKKHGKDISRLTSVLPLLSDGTCLPKHFRDHQLSGNLSDFRECHIEPNWLLIYRIENDQLILTATGTGSHADLFGL